MRGAAMAKANKAEAQKAAEEANQSIQQWWDQGATGGEEGSKGEKDGAPDQKGMKEMWKNMMNKLEGIKVATVNTERRAMNQKLSSSEKGRLDLQAKLNKKYLNMKNSYEQVMRATSVYTHIYIYITK